jgi:A/G-specific adenine glycosylase
LVSEFMLQQTQAARVAPVFVRFMEAFPSVGVLAGASSGDVVRQWAGLGYNRRAVALWRAAGLIHRERGGRIPDDPIALRGLPGVGPYTAAAVASIAFGRRIPAVDTNVRRVVSRFALGTDGGTATAVDEAAARLVPSGDPGGWNQAVMDLGRTVCRPVPRCAECPIRSGCRFRREGPRASSPPARRQAPFRGSSRELRGRVVRALTAVPSMSLGALEAATDTPLDRVAVVVEGLDRDGLVRAGPAALRGRRTGRVRLA